MNKIGVVASFSVLSTLFPGEKQALNSYAQNNDLSNKTEITYKAPVVNPNSPPSVRMYPDIIIQGETGVVSALSHKDLKNAYVVMEKADGTSVRKNPLYNSGKGSYFGFIGTNPKFSEGDYRVIVTDKTKSFSDTIKFFLKKGVFASQRLKLKKSVGALFDTKLDKKIIDDALNQVSDTNYANALPPYEVPTKNGLMTTEFAAMRPKFHSGIDIAAPMGARIISPQAGKILLAKKFPLEGVMVVVDHGPFKTVIMHMLPDLKVAKGDIVKEGQILGFVGSTGRSTGAHAHVTTIISGQAVGAGKDICPSSLSVDPENFLKHVTRDKDLVKRIAELGAPAYKDETRSVGIFAEYAKDPYMAQQRALTDKVIKGLQKLSIPQMIKKVR